MWQRLVLKPCLVDRYSRLPDCLYDVPSGTALLLDSGLQQKLNWSGRSDLNRHEIAPACPSDRCGYRYATTGYLVGHPGLEPGNPRA